METADTYEQRHPKSTLNERASEKWHPTSDELILLIINQLIFSRKQKIIEHLTRCNTCHQTLMSLESFLENNKDRPVDALLQIDLEKDRLLKRISDFFG